MPQLQILHTEYLDYYKKKQPITLLKHLNKLKTKIGERNLFNFYNTQSSCYSSQIEGNIIDFDSFLKYKLSGMNTNPKSFAEIEDLIKGYEYAQKHVLNLKNLLKAHEISRATVIENPKYRGVFRDKEVYIVGNGKVVYTSAAEKKVNAEISKLINDIALLTKRELSLTETFYYASMIHLVFEKIHPFADGNGRMGRLLEKWFLAESIGKHAWLINSEKLYHQRQQSYYKNIHIGKTYEDLNFDLCLPFLLMLPMALRTK